MTREEMNDKADKLADIPAADVVPVKHGRWVWDENALDWGLGAFRCSECHCQNQNLPHDRSNPYMFEGSRYCPNCGARMDGKEEDLPHETA